MWEIATCVLTIAAHGQSDPIMKTELCRREGCGRPSQARPRQASGKSTFGDLRRPQIFNVREAEFRQAYRGFLWFEVDTPKVPRPFHQLGT